MGGEKECSLCKRHSNKDLIIYEDAFYAVMPAERPASDGHVTIILKRHAPMDEASTEELYDAAKLSKRFSLMLRKAFSAEGAKVMIENGNSPPNNVFSFYVIKGFDFDVPGLPTESEHFHVDIVPCYSDVRKYNYGRVEGFQDPFDVVKMLR